MTNIADINTAQIVETVWSSMLDLSINCNDSKISEKDLQGYLTAYIHISGNWNGHIALQCPLGLAKQAACVMFTPEIPSLDDIRDALGELVNMIGGNIKSMLPYPCQLSMPTVTVGLDYMLNTPNGKIVLQRTFGCDNQMFMVSFFEINNVA